MVMLYLAPFDGYGARELGEARLAHIVGETVPGGLHGVDGGDVDDPALAPLDHVGPDGAHAQERALEVGIQHLVPFRPGVGLEEVGQALSGGGA